MSREEGVKQKCQEKEVPGERDAREKKYNEHRLKRKEKARQKVS